MRYRLPQPYEELDHTADVGVGVAGQSPEQALARLVLAFSAVVSGSTEPEPDELEVVVQAEQGDRATMAIDVLRELLYRLETEQLVPTSCEVMRFHVDQGAAVSVGMRRLELERAAEGTELKAVTYHAARFEEAQGIWSAQVLFDV
jgi:SHS2 domain-containing protein